MWTVAPALAFTSLLPLERSLPSVCTWDMESPAGSGLLGLGICPERFFLRPSLSKCPRSTDGPNSLSVRGPGSRLFLSPAGLSSESLSQLDTEVLCLRMSFQPSFHGQVWELIELTFTCRAHTHTHTHILWLLHHSVTSVPHVNSSFLLSDFVLWQWPLLLPLALLSPVTPLCITNSINHNSCTF